MTAPFSFSRALLIAGAVALGGCASGVPTDGAPSASEANSRAEYQATVVRTREGIAHVTAPDWASLGYGHGYVVAQDTLCTLADAFVTMRGERSRHFGADATAVYPSTLENVSNLDSDFFFRLMADDAMIARLRDAQDAELDALVSGYAAGYSRYVREIRAGEHPGRHHGCRQAPWLDIITADDMYRRLYTANIALATTRLISAVANAKPPGEQRSTQLQAFDLQALLSPLDATRVGSNAIAFGANATGGPHGLLFGNPHWMWTGMDRFHHVHLRIPGRLDVQGASILGVPLVVIGFNRDVAWSHTVSTAQRFTLYRLTLAEADPTSYMYDGETRKLRATHIEVPVLRSDGSIEHVARTLYRSHFGPMLAMDWSEGHALTLRAANEENLRSFRNWKRWGLASSLEEFIRIQKEEAAIPWVNTIAAARNDPRAWYADIGAMPNVSDAKLADCGVAPRTLDGSRSTCEWDSDPDSVQPGAFGVSRMPSLAARDFVANMNDSFWLANPRTPLVGYARMIGGVDQPQSFRTRMGLTLVREALNVDDGLPGRSVTSETVRDFVLNGRSLTAELFLPQVLADVCRVPTVRIEPGDAKVDITEACSVLATWDRRGNVDSVGAHIWDAFWTLLGKEVPEASRYRVPFDPTEAVGTPRDLNTAHAGVARALAKAAQLISAGPVALDAPVGSYQFLEDADKQKIPLPGGCGDSGYFAIVCTRFNEGAAVVAPQGNSYMQVVAFDDEGPQAWTLLLSSQSTDPASPYYRNGARDYSQKAWRRAPFKQAEIDDASVERVQLNEVRRP